MDIMPILLLFFVIVGVLIAILILNAFRTLSEEEDEGQRADQKQLAVVEYGTVERFIGNMEREKPVRFTPEQLALFTQNYSIRLGSGGFGVVYRGQFPNNGIMLAVKVLNDSVSKTVLVNQFMAEVSTIGRTYHKNLVRLYGFCYDFKINALVYEYLENGSLDRILFDGNNDQKIRWSKLYEIAIGTAKGLLYLHEDCQQRIIHYDIKPGNILLDSNFCAKVADFGLAKFCNLDKSHITLSGGRGTPGYAAPELWMPFRVTYKCDVYSYGMMLFEIMRRRRNFDGNQSESQQWFPRQVWDKFERGELSETMVLDCKIEEEDRDKAEVMCMVAFWCIQYLPEARPSMRTVLKILEGGTQIPVPPNPFQHLQSSGVEATVSIEKGMDSSKRESDFQSSSGGITSQFTEN